MNLFPQRKFVFYDGSLAVGDAIAADDPQPYVHMNVAHGIASQVDLDRLVAGWLTGDEPGFEVWFAPLEDDQLELAASAEDALRAWAAARHCSLRFPQPNRTHDA